MEYTNGAWLQQTVPDLPVVPDGQHHANDDWKDPSSSVQGVSGTVSVAGQGMDLSDFGLGDLSVPSSSSSSVSTPSTSYFGFPQQHFFLPSAPGSYNTVAYGTTQWSNPTPQLPLSSYSSLNGATSATSASSLSQQQQQQQQAMSSAAQSPMMIDTMPPPKPIGPTPEQRKATFMSTIKPLLTPNSFTGAGAVAQLVGHIEDYGALDVDASTRLEILTKMRDNAGNHYFRAWVENEGAMDVTREWLKSGYTAKADSQLVETIMPLLHLTRKVQIIDRLPLTLESLKASKLGKIIVRLVKEPPAPAIKDMASNLERKWRQLLVASQEESKRMDVDDDPKGKKRKADPSISKAAPPSKRPAVSAPGTSIKTVAVKKDVKTVVREVKDAKSDSSFFSAPKPKPKLPSFKKASPASTAVKKEPDHNVAQPSSINPFEEALKSMAKTRRDSPATSTPPPPVPSSSAPSAAPSLTVSGKPKKMVTWAPEGKLELIKLIERAVYDDDPADVSAISLVLSYTSMSGTQGTFSNHNVRDLDRDEGAALHAHLFEEQMEWTEPIPLETPLNLDFPRGENSQEKAVQEAREQSALVALYTLPNQIPESPAEPSTQIPDEQVDEGVRIMLTGAEVDVVFWSGGAPAVVEPPKHSVAELVNQLAAGTTADTSAVGALSQGSQPQMDLKAFGLDANAMQGVTSDLNPEQLQQLVQALSQGAIFQSQAPGQPAQGGDWNSEQYSDYDRGNYYEDVSEEAVVVVIAVVAAVEAEAKVSEVINENHAVSLQQEGEHRTYSELPKQETNNNVPSRL
ncbi:predicted protein [Postia placenta Mad-698-R]|nr:predicted protein [Postia placenta Mad-698-R]